MNLYEAIYVRKSCRKYKKDAIGEGVIEKLRQASCNFFDLWPDISVETRTVTSVSGVFTVKAPCYLLIASENSATGKMKAGCLAEQYALLLTTMGLGSCFIGMGRGPKVVIKSMRYPVQIILAFGVPADSSLRQEEEPSKRKRLDAVTVFKSAASDSIRTLLGAAVLAPSSVNHQPWRFIVNEEKIHIFLKKSSVQMLRRLEPVDMGVVLSHFLVAADHLWLETVVKRLDIHAQKEYNKYQYVISIAVRQ